jgi:hypothetical protein
MTVLVFACVEDNSLWGVGASGGEDYVRDSVVTFILVFWCLLSGIVKHKHNNRSDDPPPRINLVSEVSER